MQSNLSLWFMPDCWVVWGKCASSSSSDSLASSSSDSFTKGKLSWPILNKDPTKPYRLLKYCSYLSQELTGFVFDRIESSSCLAKCMAAKFIRFRHPCLGGWCLAPLLMTPYPDWILGNQGICGNATCHACLPKVRTEPDSSSSVLSSSSALHEAG